MKRISIYLIMSVVAVFAAGCIEDVELPQEEVVFKAVSDQAVTRTELGEDLSVLWQENDMITVFYGSDYNSKFRLGTGAGTTEGSFLGVDYEDGTKYKGNYAIYPYSIYNHLYDVKTVTLNINGTQPYKEGGFDKDMNPMVAKTDDTGDFTLRFHNVCGMLKVSVVGDKKIKSATLSGVNAEPLAGECYVNLNDMTVRMDNTASTSIYLDCGDGVQLDPDEPTDFWFVVPPVVFNDGFGVYLTDAEGGGMLCYRFKHTEIKRNTVQPMSVITYVPENGESEIKDVTIADFNAAKSDEKTLYRINGEVTSISNEQSGNFYVTDDTGSVYVYGISNWSDYKNGFKVGANVTLVGNRGDYYGVAQLVNGYIESYEPPQDGGDDDDDDDDDDDGWKGVIETDWEDRTFHHRSVAMRFTADWCGYCPMMAEAFENARKSLSGNLEVISMHCSGGLEFKPGNELMDFYGITGFPTGVVDGRTMVYNYAVETTTELTLEAVADTESSFDAIAGMGWKSEVTGSSVRVDLAAYLKESGSYRMTVLLVEDKIVGYQAGESNNYVHNGVPRAVLTDIMGDSFTTADDDEVKTFTYTGEIPSGCDMDNMRIVAYVYAKDSSSGASDGYYINNSASSSLGESLSLAFDVDGGGNTEDITQGDDIDM